jgi:carboxypeptidase family protein
MLTSQKFRGLFVPLIARSLLPLLCGATIAAQQPAANSSETKSPATRAITGRVVSEGQPVPGATVFIVAIGSTNGQRTGTDNEGNFSAEGLDAGAYRVSVNSPGYVSEGSPTVPNNPPTYYRPGDSVTFTLIKGGVISGTVTNGDGEPVVNATVRAWRIRDSEGKPIQNVFQSRDRATDDRGYYRLYGLQPGSYIISAGGATQFSGPVVTNAYANDAPTFAPASTRDTAVEIVVSSGQEATADIRYRGEPGHSVSGRVTGAQPQPPYLASVRLTDVSGHAMIGATNAARDDQAFQLNGVSDGDYEINAITSSPNGEALVSAARRVSVKGSDVTGIDLALAPLGSISGRVNLETDPKLNCGRRRESFLRETAISARRAPTEKSDAKTSKDKTVDVIEPTPILFAFAEAVPNDKNEINLRNLGSGTYSLETRLLAAGWFIKGITVGSGSTRATSPNIPRDGINLKSGERVAGLTVTIAEGAASFRGRFTVAEGQSLPPNLRVYLVPVEKEVVADVLRFFETRADTDGGFGIGNIAPGHYWMIGRAADEGEPATIKPIRQDSALRSQVLKEAEKTGNEIQLQPCQRILDYEIRYPAAANDAKPKP